jgi:hypothetical protein
MMRKTMVILGLVALCASRADAQGAAAKPAAAADSASRKFVGSWEGRYYSDHAPENDLKLVISRDTAWKATMEITSEMNLPIAQMAEFTVEGNNAWWKQSLMGETCETTAALIGGTLKGEIRCGHASIGFVLKRKEGA